MNVKLSYDIDFSAVVLEKDRVFPNFYTVQINLLTQTENSQHQNIAFRRIQFFFREIFDNGILLNESNPKFQEILALWGPNRLVTLPEEPYEQILGFILYHKLSAITEGNFAIDSIVIGSKSTDNLMYTIDSFENFDLFTESESKEIKWWDKADLSTADIPQLSGALTWTDVDLDWDTDLDEDENDNEVDFIPEPDIVVRPAKPPSVVVLDDDSKTDDEDDN